MKAIFWIKTRFSEKKKPLRATGQLAGAKFEEKKAPAGNWTTGRGKTGDPGDPGVGILGILGLKKTDTLDNYFFNSPPN